MTLLQAPYSPNLFFVQILFRRFFSDNPQYVLAETPLQFMKYVFLRNPSPFHNFPVFFVASVIVALLFGLEATYVGTWQMRG